MKSIFRYYIPAYILALLCSVAGLMWNNDRAIIPFAVLSVLPLLFLAINYAVAKIYTAKLKNTNVADGQAYLLSHRKDAEESSAKLMKKLCVIRRLTAAYTVVLALLAVCASVLGGLLFKINNVLFYLCLIYAGMLFIAVSGKFPKRVKIVLDDDAPKLSKEKYPAIHAAVSRAAGALSCKKEIVILLSSDCNASIVSDRNRYYLNLGVFLLQILSEEELYCICLHEFSHVSDKNRATKRATDYASAILDAESPTFLQSILTNLFIAFDMHYFFVYNIFRYANAVVSETDADRDMLKNGDARVAASALLKLSYNDKFSWEDVGKDQEPVFKPEEPSRHYLFGQIRRFLDAVEERRADWDAMVGKEILANNATHPTLKMRLETMGVKDAKTIEDQSSPEYLAEKAAALEFAESTVYNNMKKDYAELRKENYIKPLERVTEWEKNGCPVLAEQYADLITDLRDLGRASEAEALCDRAIRELDENSSLHAYFIKGCAMLSRYDAAGMDYIYHALENNHNYLDEGLDMIGSFCCMTGREQDLLDYRKRALEQEQKHVDEDSEADFLSPRDNLSRDDMPAEMREEILAYIKSVDSGIIRKIYLVRKTVNPNYFISSFVLRFYGGTDKQRSEILHKIFRYLDSYPADWQFSLFDYFDCPGIKFDKIEGSLIYEKSDNEGD